MTYSLYVYYMFDEMFVMDQAWIAQVLVQVLNGQHCQHLVYVFGKLQAVLGNGLEDSLKKSTNLGTDNKKQEFLGHNYIEEGLCMQLGPLNYTGAMLYVQLWSFPFEKNSILGIDSLGWFVGS